MLGLAAECSWGGSEESRPTPRCVSGLISCVDGIVTNVRKTGWAGHVGANRGFCWNTQISVRQQRSQGGSWGWELRGEIWAGDIIEEVTILRMMFRPVGMDKMAQREKKISLLLLLHLPNPVALCSTSLSALFPGTCLVASSPLDDYTRLLFFLILILFLRDRSWMGQREKETKDLKQAAHSQHRARCGAGSHQLRDHDLSQSSTLDQLSHPGAPTPALLFCFVVFVFVFPLCLHSLSYTTLLFY